MPLCPPVRRFVVMLFLRAASFIALATVLSAPAFADPIIYPPLGYVGPWPPPAQVVPATPAQSVQPATAQIQSQLQTQESTMPVAAPASPDAAASSQKQSPGWKAGAPPATPENRNTETLITAAHMSSDQETGILTAEGHVEISRSGYILHADKVTYDQNTGVMHAEGHVAMLTPEGDVEYANQEDVTGDMKQA